MRLRTWRRLFLGQNHTMRPGLPRPAGCPRFVKLTASGNAGVFGRRRRPAGQDADRPSAPVCYRQRPVAGFEGTANSRAAVPGAITVTGSIANQFISAGPGRFPLLQEGPG